MTDTVNGAPVLAPVHYHCPHGCEHPQPFVHPRHGLICGRCWFIEARVARVYLCTPERCADD